MFRINHTKICLWKENRFLPFPKKKLWAFKVEIVLAWKNFEQNYLYSSQWIKSHEIKFRIMKKMPVKFISKSEQTQSVENSVIGPDSKTLTSNTRECWL